MNGSRSAASTGGTNALRIPISPATKNAAPTPPSATPGTRAAATQTAIAPTTQARMKFTRRKRGAAGCQRSCSPYADELTPQA